MKQKYILPLFNYERVHKSEYDSDKREKKCSIRNIACALLLVSTLTTFLVLIILIAFNVIFLRQKEEHNIIYSKTTLIECKKECWHNGTCEIVKIGDLIEFKCICKLVKLLIYNGLILFKIK
jgi:hypothetical protein